MGVLLTMQSGKESGLLNQHPVVFSELRIRPVMNIIESVRYCL